MYDEVQEPFTTKGCNIDGEITALAKTARPEFVTVVNYERTIGIDQPLHIYKMVNPPVVPYILTRDLFIIQPPDSVSRQHNTTKGLARCVHCSLIRSHANVGDRFFAASWKNRQLPDGHVAQVLHKRVDKVSVTWSSSYHHDLSRA